MIILRHDPGPLTDIANLHLPKSLASLSGLRPTRGNVARARRAARKRSNIRARAPKH